LVAARPDDVLGLDGMYMKPKTVIAVILLLFVAASVVRLAVGDSRARTEISRENDDATVPVVTISSSEYVSKPEEAQRRVIVYYFHGTARCLTCRTIEQYAHEALETGFPRELQSGTIEWHAVNVEEPQHQHFISDYQLHTRSLVLAEMEGETQVRWKNLDRIWELVSSKDAFVTYVQSETRAYLGEN
jgi:hypothetical protein